MFLGAETGAGTPSREGDEDPDEDVVGDGNRASDGNGDAEGDGVGDRHDEGCEVMHGGRERLGWDEDWGGDHDGDGNGDMADDRDGNWEEVRGWIGNRDEFGCKNGDGGGDGEEDG